MEMELVTVRRGDHAPRGTVEPGLLVERSLGTIDRMAEAMWQDASIANTGKRRHMKWADEHPDTREQWIRSATAAFLTLLEPQPE
jgi:hypothetical protein